MSLIFRPLFEKKSSTYTYLLADSNTKEAIIIDAVDETQQRDIGLIKELGKRSICAGRTDFLFSNECSTSCEIMAYNMANPSNGVD
jgi:hypothetical protein